MAGERLAGQVHWRRSTAASGSARTAMPDDSVGLKLYHAVGSRLEDWSLLCDFGYRRPREEVPDGSLGLPHLR